MKKGNMQKVIPMGRGVKVPVLIASAVFFAAFVGSYVQLGRSVHTLALALCSVLACAGLYEAFTGRIILTEDELRVAMPFNRKVYRRSEILAVTWARECPVVLKMASGEEAALPGVGRTSQGVVNSIRAWLKHRTVRADSPHTAHPHASRQGL
jgi:hypothetical protein